MDHFHVLIVDDDKDTASFFSLVLSLVGFECEVVNTGREAIARLAATQPDMVLLDMRLGQEITGEDILYQIRSNPRFEKTRVIITTAYPIMAQPIANLADLTLIKPIGMDQLQALSERLTSMTPPKARQYYFRDPVTDLYNREFFLARLEHAFERVRRRADFLFAVLVFTIQVQAEDGDPVEPEQLNHVLRQAAGGMMSSFRPTDTFSRLDGGRFASIHEEMKQASDLGLLVSRLQQVVAQPVQLGPRLFHPSALVGSALYDRRYPAAEELLAAAEATFEKVLDYSRQAS
jgi:diguanylate cyclase (GGDEF)-like protein